MQAREQFDLVLLWLFMRSTVCRISLSNENPPPASIRDGVSSCSSIQGKDFLSDTNLPSTGTNVVWTSSLLEGPRLPGYL